MSDQLAVFLVILHLFYGFMLGCIWTDYRNDKHRGDL